MARALRNRYFTSLKIEGRILPPDYLQTVATLKAPKQAASDYGLSKSLAIKDEISRYWLMAKDLYASYTKRYLRRDLPPEQVGVEEWLERLLRIVLGYDDLTSTESVFRGDRFFRLTHHACAGSVPLLLVTQDFNLDKADSSLGHDGRRQSPHGMMQEYLNSEDHALWGFVSNGTKLRVLRDNASMTRNAYIEADLDLLFSDELYPDFAAMWLAIHASRLRTIDDQPSSSIIETWRKEANASGERVRENLRDGVTESLRQFGNGFLQHPSNRQLREKLESGELSAEQYFEQLLRLVYRLLFLFAAEDRDLLHSPEATNEQRGVFAEGYGLSRFRDLVLRRRNYDQNQDLWQGLKITFRALSEGANGLGLPALGGLFRGDQCADLDASAIANEHLLEAVRTLAFFRTDRGLSRVNYKDMDTEELGSVYESLLELHPVLEVGTSPWRFAFSGDSDAKNKKGSDRKLTGSYYTPPSLVGELIASTLDPVIADAISSCPEYPRTAILELNVIDPACGSGHFLLAAARRLATEIARIDSDTDTPDETTRRQALREVVRHCIFGVDRNPLAVELCKTALWLETIQPGKPLTFLDSHILRGDSLVGVLDPEIMADGIPESAYKPLTGDNRAICLDLKKRNRSPTQKSLFDQEAVLEVAVSNIDLDDMPEDTIENVERKRAAWEAGLNEPTRARETLRSNLFVSAYFGPKTHDNHELIPQTQDLLRMVDGRPERKGVREFSCRIALDHDYFHWYLAFPEIMQDGGFDVVLGNPPWERLKLQEKEFFASRSPKIANAPNKPIRDQLIRQLNRETASPIEKNLHFDFLKAKRGSEAASHFVRTAGRYPLTGVGDVNTYAVFAELFLQLVNPSGRAGMIVPTGIATDKFTKGFFDHSISRQNLVSLFDFENRERIFAGIDSRIKFCLLTLCGKNNQVPEPVFAFYLHQIDHLKDAERRFALTSQDFSLFNPNTRTCPIFRTRRDMEITRKMYQRAGVLWNEGHGTQTAANPWGVRFSTMFHMSNDSSLFRTRQQLEDDGWALDRNVFFRGLQKYLPLYEAKLFHQYDHRFATFEGVSKTAITKGSARAVPTEEKTNTTSVVQPRYWVPEKNVAKKLDNDEFDIIAEPSRAEPSRAEPSRAEPSRAEPSRAEPSRAEHYATIRLITRSTDRRTILCAVLPRCGMGHKAGIINFEIGWSQCD